MSKTKTTKTKSTVMRSKKGTIGLYLLLVVFGLNFATPMLFTIFSSLKTKVEIFSRPFNLPSAPQWSNYVTAWVEANMSRYFINSLIQAGSTVIVLVAVSTLASFALARLNLKHSKKLLLFFTLGMMIPMHTVIVPVSYMIGALHLKNQIWALVLIYVAFALPFSILVITNFMKRINASLEEAAIIDGASNFQIYRHIALPLAMPAISTVSIFNFLGAWNNILFPLLFINNKKLKPVALGLLNFNGERGSEYGPLMAAIVITVAVPIVLYLLFQEKVEGGLSRGAVKG